MKTAVAELHSAQSAVVAAPHLDGKSDQHSNPTL